ncbi:MAG: flagellar protein FlaG [Selenomonas sp.]|jgi:flagellar protein FlaG|nr:flagellar protein FlaG [Selenomonas sp.]
MIGKVQDMVTAAIVVGAADKVSSDNSAVSTQNANSQQGIASDLSHVSASQQVQQTDQANTDSKDKQNKKDKDNQLMDEKSVNLMTKELNELMSKINCDLEFSYHKEVNLMSVKMIDKNTQEVLKEMPPESMIKHMMAAKDWLGAFLDKNA